MSAAACAKARLDGGRAAGAAEAYGRIVLEGASATEMLYGLKGLTDEEKASLMALSARNCAWANKLDAWSKDNLDTITAILKAHGVDVTYPE